MKLPTRFTINAVDDSMAPAICEGDLVEVVPGFQLNHDHFAAVIIDNGEDKDSQLLIRSVDLYGDGIALRAANRRYPTLVFEGEARHRVVFIGMVGSITSPNHIRRGGIITAVRAVNNRMTLEKNYGEIEYDPAH